MKKLLVLIPLFALAAGGLAYAGALRRWAISTAGGSPWTASAPSTDCNFSEVGTGSGAGGAPKTFATGLNLSGCKSIYVCVSAPSGQTLSGGGSLDAYYFDPELSEWAREKDGDWSITVAAGTEREQCFSIREIFGTGYGCGYWRPNGVTGSGGTTLTTTATCIQ